MSTKLHINLSQGILDVEGEESFVKSIYDDFRDEALKNFAAEANQDAAEGSTPAADPPAARSRTSSRKPAQKKPDGSKVKRSDYNPKFNSNLDFAKLDAFYGEFTPTGHPEKILIFATFLRDKLKIAPCSADDIYSCYFVSKSKTRTPKAFVQALRDTQNKKGYIELKSLTEISITITGDNHFNLDLKKKSGDV